MKIVNYIVLLVLMVMVLSLSPAEAGKLRLGIMPKSTHWDSSKQYNESHDGKFIEYRLTEDSWTGFMNFQNSLDDTSNAYYWIKEYPINDYLTWGYLLGGVTGYSKHSMMPYSSFMFTVHFGQVGARIAMIPLLVNGYQAYVEF